MASHVYGDRHHHHHPRRRRRRIIIQSIQGRGTVLRLKAFAAYILFSLCRVFSPFSISTPRHPSRDSTTHTQIEWHASSCYTDDTRYMGGQNFKKMVSLKLSGNIFLTRLPSYWCFAKFENYCSPILFHSLYFCTNLCKLHLWRKGCLCHKFALVNGLTMHNWELKIDSNILSGDKSSIYSFYLHQLQNILFTLNSCFSKKSWPKGLGHTIQIGRLRGK